LRAALALCAKAKAKVGDRGVKTKAMQRHCEAFNAAAVQLFGGMLPWVTMDDAIRQLYESGNTRLKLEGRIAGLFEFIVWHDTVWLASKPKPTIYRRLEAADVVIDCYKQVHKLRDKLGSMRS
jgi:hypothetical protein